jgi:cellulose synthase/poly-beta-1,6-N-acetylglucosamine synthase-like glycosyltransferase
MTAVAAVNAVAYGVIALSLVYFLAAMLAGLHEMRRHRSPLGEQSDAAYGRPLDGATETFDVYVLIPCLNEADVIGRTVRALGGGRRVTTIVIDDASDDRTGAIAREAGGDTTIVLRRELPDARTGKGAALNHGYGTVRRLVAERGQDPARVLILVMDADGLLSDGAFEQVQPRFEDERVGGVQLAVRIRNRDHNFLTRFQDFQFWSMSAITQFGRMKTGTVSLGGNGQFTRMSALERLPGDPWSDSLTEDLDLAVSLALAGWRLDTTPHASVDQQAVTSLRRLIVQRRRWYQGHMTAGRRLPEIWRAREVGSAQVLELSAYLAVPWLFDLPWSLLSHWTVFLTLTRMDALFSFVTGPTSLAVGLALWYLFAFAPACLTSIVYLRRDRTLNTSTAFVMGHSFVVMNYLSYVCAWGALYRMLRGRTGWDKTARAAEPSARGSATHLGGTGTQLPAPATDPELLSGYIPAQT